MNDQLIYRDGVRGSCRCRQRRGGALGVRGGLLGPVERHVGEQVVHHVAVHNVVQLAVHPRAHRPAGARCDAMGILRWSLGLIGLGAFTAVARKSKFHQPTKHSRRRCRQTRHTDG